AAGLGGAPFGWSADGITDTSQLTSAQLTTLNAVIAAHDPTKQLLNIIPFSIFLSRWLDAEYILLLQKRAAAVTAGTNAALIRGWDLHMALDQVDLNSTGAQSLKTALINNNILTQTRANIIFS
ncbi:MAG TPA: hypothetical protein VEP90_16475, partial [Methylomirabilota bacterium]|nr:hypothetical protein [Methylomirabilota bacterium]